MSSSLLGHNTFDDYNESSVLIEGTIANAGQSQAERFFCNKEESLRGRSGRRRRVLFPG